MAYDPLEREMTRNAIYGNSGKNKQPTSFVEGLLDSFNDHAHESRKADLEAKLAQQKSDDSLRAEIIKQRLRTQGQKDMVDYKGQAQANDPFQQMLQRRMQASDPLATIPTADNPDQSVSFAADRPEMTRNGKMQLAPVNDHQQKMAFITQYNKMMDDAQAGKGPAPAPAMQAVYQKYFNEVNKIPKKKEDEGLDPNNIMGQESLPKPNIQAPPSGSIFQQAMQTIKDAMAGKHDPYKNPQPQMSQSVTDGQQPSAQQPEEQQASKHSVGDTVTYQGKQYKVQGVRDDGSLELGEAA